MWFPKNMLRCSQPTSLRPCTCRLAGTLPLRISPSHTLVGLPLFLGDPGLQRVSSPALLPSQLFHGWDIPHVLRSLLSLVLQEWHLLKFLWATYPQIPEPSAPAGGASSTAKALFLFPACLFIWLQFVPSIHLCVKYWRR